MRTLRNARLLATASQLWLCSGLMACSAEDPASSAGPDSLAVVFSPSGGTFLASQTVSLSVENQRAQLHFTLDGSLPTAASPVYSAPLLLDRSTRLRALAIEPTLPGSMGSAGSAGAAPFRQGPVFGENYLRVAAELSSFKSHLPLVVIHTFESGSLNPDGTEFVPATIDVLEPGASGTALIGKATLDSRIGIHVRGATSRDFPKKQYAVELREEMVDDDLDQPLLGMPADSDWVLSDPITMDRSLVRNALGFALSNKLGRYAPRTRFVEVFLASGGGDVRSQDFLGLYTVIEKIKRGSARVDVAKLSGSDITEPALSGGYVLRIDKGTNDFQAAGHDMQFVYPDALEMRTAARKPQLDFIRGFVDGFGQAISAADFKHPTSGQPYSSFIDVDAWIDHNIVMALTKNVDALRISAYFHKDRQGLLAAGPVWDFDRSLGTPYDGRAQNPEEWKQAGSDGTDYFTEGWWRSLFRDPTFKARYKQRFLAVLTKEFAPDQLDRLVDELVSQVGPAAERNFQRWTESPPRNGSYQAEITVLKDFLRRRAAFIQAQLATWP